MPEREHVDVETIERYIEGRLAEKEAEWVRRHLERCPLCDLELRRLERFHAIDSDEDLARAGEWLYARTKLEKALTEKIVPEARRGGARVIRFRRGARAARWIVPAAAAAALIILIAHNTVNMRPRELAPERSVMRGAPAVTYGIALKEPLGDIAASPGIFRWESSREDNFFTIDIFTPTLENIYRARNVEGSAWSAPDTLAAILEPGVIYLWSVRGYRGLERVTASPSGWFRIARRPHEAPAEARR